MMLRIGKATRWPERSSWSARGHRCVTTRGPRASTKGSVANKKHEGKSGDRVGSQDRRDRLGDATRRKRLGTQANDPGHRVVWPNVTGSQRIATEHETQRECRSAKKSSSQGSPRRERSRREPCFKTSRAGTGETKDHSTGQARRFKT